MLDRETDQNEAMEAAAPILPIIHRILDDSVAFYFSEAYSPEARADHTDRAMANCIYSHAEKRMLGAAAETTGLTAINLKGLNVLNFNDKVVIRFKKVSANGRHSNYQTEQQQQYDDQLPLPGIPEPAFRLTAGYQMDAAGSALERIMIARPLGRTVFWAAQVSMIDGTVTWVDITPRRFTGTEESDFDAERARGGRG
jgi:hypothetical protein